MNKIGFLFLFIFLFSASSFADIVEIRGRGMMTGKIVSQNENEIAFKGNDGKIVRYARSDVLFFDAGDESGPVEGAEPQEKQGWSFGETTARARRFFAQTPGWLRGLRSWADRWTKKFRDFAGKPLDRSHADKQGQQLAKVMDEAAKASAELAKKRARVDAEVRRQEREAYGLPEEDSEGFKGTFGKL